MLQKMVINKIVDLISKQFKLYDIMKYVKEPNEADDRIDILEIDLFKAKKRIEELSRKQENFVQCKNCQDTPEQINAIENHTLK